jgi:ribosomal protein L21E
VLERRGRAYVVETTVGDSKKAVIARPEHIKPV